MQMTRKLWLGASAIAVLAVVAAAILQIGSHSETNSGIAAYASLEPSCDIQQGPCQAVFPDGSRISLSIAPRPIQALKPLEILVTTHGLDAQAVEVDFRGLGMDMGYNRPRLQRTAKGEYSGSGMLAICVSERMPWEATVLARTAAGVMAAPFRFETIRP